MENALALIQETLATQAERIRALERWQSNLEGTLVRLEGKIDGVQRWLMGAMLAALLALAGELIKLLAGK